MDRWDWIRFLVLVLALAAVGVLVILALEATGAIIPKREAGQLCIDAGYARVEFLAGTLHCVGVRDGNTAIEPLKDVRARMEGAK